MLDHGNPFTVALFAEGKEDHDLVAALLSQYQRFRFDVQVYPTAAAAHAAIAESRHDAYLVDATMLEADEQLLALAVSTGRPLIVLADEHQVTGEGDYVAAGAWDCLVRSTLTPPELARTLRRGSGHARQRAVEDRRREAHKMEALGRLAAGMAHEFNNLLTAILGYAEMIRESLDPHDARREDVLEIQRAGERASALTRQLLAFGRRETPQAAPLDLNATLDRLQPQLASIAGNGIVLSIDGGSGVGRVRVDEANLESVLAALVSNARDAMPRGGRLRIGTRLVDLDGSQAAAHSLAVAGLHVLLAVSDEGTGMTPHVRSHLFEPFFTTKGKGQGTGLGLPLVYAIVRQSRGGIEVESEVDKGTTVRIYWPAGQTELRTEN